MGARNSRPFCFWRSGLYEFNKTYKSNKTNKSYE